MFYFKHLQFSVCCMSLPFDEKLFFFLVLPNVNLIEETLNLLILSTYTERLTSILLDKLLRNNKKPVGAFINYLFEKWAVFMFCDYNDLCNY